MKVKIQLADLIKACDLEGVLADQMKANLPPEIFVDGEETVVETTVETPTPETPTDTLLPPDDSQTEIADVPAEPAA